MFCDNGILWVVLGIISDMEIFPSKEIESIVQKGMKARFHQHKHLCTESTIKRIPGCTFPPNKCFYAHILRIFKLNKTFWRYLKYR